jgi:hypothetical protein
MLVNEMYLGSGLGNQIWASVVTRIIAEKLGYEYGIKGKELWKGNGWMPYFWGKDVVGGSGPDGGPPDTLPEGIEYWYRERQEGHYKEGRHQHDMNPIDHGLFFLPDNTKLDGTFQNMLYIEDRRDDIREWCKVDEDKVITDYSADDICVIHFRGGDYSTGFSFLPPQYYQMAIERMKEKKSDMRFVIVTDDADLARKHIPGVEVVGAAVSNEPGGPDYKIGWYQMKGGPLSIDYSILHTAKNVIMSSSTFSFWPVWLSTELKNIIVPMYWFDWNTSDGWWRPVDSIVPEWTYMDRSGNIKTGNDCWQDYRRYTYVINPETSGVLVKYE